MKLAAGSDLVWTRLYSTEEPFFFPDLFLYALRDRDPGKGVRPKLIHKEGPAKYDSVHLGRIVFKADQALCYADRSGCIIIGPESQAYVLNNAANFAHMYEPVPEDGVLSPDLEETQIGWARLVFPFAGVLNQSLYMSKLRRIIDAKGNENLEENGEYSAMLGDTYFIGEFIGPEAYKKLDAAFMLPARPVDRTKITNWQSWRTGHEQRYLDEQRILRGRAGLTETDYLQASGNLLTADDTQERELSLIAARKQAVHPEVTDCINVVGPIGTVDGLVKALLSEFWDMKPIAKYYGAFPQNL